MLSLIDIISAWTIPMLLLLIPLVGILKKVSVYESFVEGAKNGFHTAIRIIPYLVAMFIALKVFQESGAMDLLIRLIRPLTTKANIPEEVLPLALIRPLSGSGALAMLSNILETYGPDSLIGRLASTIQGSTETTFYVLTVYFGAIGIHKVRHSLLAGLIADLSGFLAAVYIVYRVFGNF